MGPKLSFWCDCATRARKGTGAFANDWQWVFGVPAASGIGVYIASNKGATEVTSGSPILDAFLAAAAAFAITWIVAFMIRLVRTAPEMFEEQKNRVLELEKRLRPQLRMFLIAESKLNLPGIEPAENPAGVQVPYIQVAIEPLFEGAVYEPIASITSIAHRATDRDEFVDGMSERVPVNWSQDSNVKRATKGSPIRFNIAYYFQNQFFDASAANSSRLVNFYRQFGKTGEYRYRVHVDGKDVPPMESFLYVKWQNSPHPGVTLALIGSKNEK